ncbi:MAG: LysR family transcriptional regulator [Gammaproteobacteria bacterium]|nr:LysR family transcriptional regulator [Gammaproteobacteria bacterium]MCW8982663.1 LysR family transcriptional regulator [Gammaproteobacteria bacterium]
MIRATLQQLRVFQAVAEHKSFTRAAEAIHLTQPGVSTQIKRLEEIIDATLFEKMGNQIYLTPEGKELLKTCNGIFNQLAEFEENLKELHGEVAGPLNLAVVTTAKYFIPQYLGDFLRKYPKVVPKLKASNRARIAERLEANEDDLYIMTNLPQCEDIDIHPFQNDELVFFASPDHPLAKKKKIKPKQLMKERLISRETGSGIRRTYEQALKDYDITLIPYMELGSGEAIKQAVMSGIGIGILSTFSLKLELDAGRLVLLDIEGFPISRKWYAIHRKGKHLSRVAQTFLNFLQQDG